MIITPKTSPKLCLTFVWCQWCERNFVVCPSWEGSLSSLENLFFLYKIQFCCHFSAWTVLALKQGTNCTELVLFWHDRSRKKLLSHRKLFPPLQWKFLTKQTHFLFQILRFDNNVTKPTCLESTLNARTPKPPATFTQQKN